MAVLVGDGDTGDTTGIITIFVLITTAMCRTAECSSIVNISIALGDFMELTDFTVETREDLPAANMDSLHRMPNPVATPVHSVASIMEEQPGAFPHVGNRASVEVFTEVAAVTAGAVTGNRILLLKRNLRHGEQNQCALQI